MKKNITIISLISLLLIFSKIYAAEPETVSTFHCISIYWSVTEGSASNICNVQYRKSGGSNSWHNALQLVYSENPSNQYRGSIVNLAPDTEYEIKLSLESGTIKTILANTWNETFPIKNTVTLSSGTTASPLTITDGGSESEGYVLYTAPPEGLEIDVNNNEEACVIIEASWVILRGVTLKGAKKHGIILGEVQNIVIEDCDVSGWGRLNTEVGLETWGEDLNSAIFSDASSLKTIIIQRNKLHHPRWDSNSWLEPENWIHPQGPQGISFIGSQGNHVIRYNEIYSDEDHKFNDSMGEWNNFSYAGFPNRDSDIYNNRIANCWDDGLEIEGACMNVRVWANYVEHAYNMLGLATTSLGPHYIWKNVVDFSQLGPEETDPTRFYRGGAFFKMGSDEQEFSNGSMFMFHNTALQPPPWHASQNGLTSGVQEGLFVTEASHYLGNVKTRNNILHTRADEEFYAIYNPRKEETNDFDYDMYNGVIEAKPNSEQHGVQFALDSSPQYDPNNTEGEFALTPGTPGFDAGDIIPNFNDYYNGISPDIGASEHGQPPMIYGVDANWTNWLQQIQDGNNIQLDIKVFLQGAYSVGEMTADLNQNGFIPLDQPFNQAPWNYTGTENVNTIPTDVVDWILVSLRTNTSEASTITQRAGFLKTDGTIVDTDGINPLAFVANEGEYYIVVEHRNHLSVMSAEKVSVSQ